MTSIFSRVSAAFAIVALVISPVFSYSAQAATPMQLAQPNVGGTCAGTMKLHWYSELTGVHGAGTISSLSAGVTTVPNNAGSLKDALNSGNFVGMEDGELTFKDTGGKLEQYNWATGAGVLETAASPLLPISLVNPNPHAGETLISAGNVKNANIIDTYDDWVMMLDADGSTSAYWKGAGTLAADYTYTSLTGGGALSGTLLSTLKTNPKFIGAENLRYLTLNAADTGAELYDVTTGAYVSAWGVTTPLSGGPLNGVTLGAAVHNTHAIPGVTFLGVAELDYVFFDSANGSLVFYNHASLTNTWVGSATTLSGASLAGGPFTGTLAAAKTGGRLLGVSDAEIDLIDTAGQLQQYNILTGVGPATFAIQPLEGPQVTKDVVNPAFVDLYNDAGVYLDDDGTLSVYFQSTRTMFADYHWKTFTGGPLAGQTVASAVSSNKIVAANDGYIEFTEADGTLGTYLIATGAYTDWMPLASTVGSAAKLSGGPLDGAKISDAVTNQVAGARFLGIAIDGLFFAVCEDPATIELDSATSTGSETNANHAASPFAKLLVKGVVSTAQTATLTQTGGTATSGTDYTAYAPTTITIPVGAYDGTAATAISIPAPAIVGDTAFESNETVDFTLSVPATSTGIVLGDTNANSATQTTHTNTIENDDLPSGVWLELSPATTEDELDSGTTAPATFPVLYVLGNAASASTATITVAGTATAGATNDYTMALTPIVVNIPAGVYPAGSTIAIPMPNINGDTTIEADETIALTLSGVSGVATFGDANANTTIATVSTHTIKNDDTAVLVEFTNATTSGPENGATPTTFPKIAVKGTVKPGGLTLHVTPTGGTATGTGADYAFTSPQVITIPAGTYDGTSATSLFTITPPAVNNDAVYEGNETVTFGLANLGSILQSGDANGDATTLATHTFTIVDDETPPAPAGGGGNGPITPIVFNTGSGSGSTGITNPAAAPVPTPTPAPTPAPTIPATKNPTTTAPVVTTPSTPTPTMCGSELTTFIKKGRPNSVSDVMLLQTFLNTVEGEKLTVNGIYDDATYAAVHRYQTKYLDDVMKPWGVDASTGYVYKTTRAHVNARLCPDHAVAKGTAAVKLLELESVQPAVKTVTPVRIQREEVGGTWSNIEKFVIDAAGASFTKSRLPSDEIAARTNEDGSAEGGAPDLPEVTVTNTIITSEPVPAISATATGSAQTAVSALSGINYGQMLGIFIASLLALLYFFITRSDKKEEASN